jgi:putative DNA primase/helicase
MAVKGCDLKTAVGMLVGGDYSETQRSPEAHAAHHAKTKEQALNIWRYALSAAGSPVETYLQSRGIVMPIPPSLRYMPNQKHTDGTRWPCMVAYVTDGVGFLGIHRTYLREDGGGKAPVDEPKRLLGPTNGGFIPVSSNRTWPERIVCGEGIETTLSVTQESGRIGIAGLSAGNMAAIGLPSVVEEVIILADNDAAGEAGTNAATTRWIGEGRRVRIARPPSEFKDFNDQLLNKRRAAA